MGIDVTYRAVSEALKEYVLSVQKKPIEPSWRASRQVDNRKNIKFLCCPVYAGQHFYAANNCFS